MNLVTLSGQNIHNIYATLPLSANSAVRAVVIYSVNMQGNVDKVTFHDTSNADVTASFELSNSLTEVEWIALIDNTIQQPMQPSRVQGVDSTLGVVTCTRPQYIAITVFLDDLRHFYKIKQTDKIDRVVTSDLLTGRVTLKAVITDAPTVATWLLSFSEAIEAESLVFDTP